MKKRNRYETDGRQGFPADEYSRRISVASAFAFAKRGANALYIVDMAEEKAEATLREIRKYCSA